MTSSEGATITRARVRFWFVSATMAAAGVVGSIWNHLLPWEWAQHLLRDLSVALFVAGLLAVSVDFFFKSEFARDAFNAAFSYVLPQELKQEIRRIMEYKFLCEKHYMVLQLIPRDDQRHLLQLNISVERTVRNISRYKQDIKNSFAIDEWGFPNARSVIERCTLTFGDNVYDSKPRTDLSADAIGMETETISIKRNDEVNLISKGYEIKPANSEFMINFSSPTVNPVVDIHIPAGLNHSFGFGVPEADVTKSSLFERYELNGTQFPGQYMRLRWWPADTAVTAGNNQAESLGTAVRAPRRSE
jgi:hypothetical protein